MIFKKEELARLNRSCPMLGGVKLGDKLEKVEKGELEAEVFFPIIIEYEVTTGAASGLEIFNSNAPFDFEILDVIIQSRGASINGTMKLTDGTNDITDAIVCAVDKTMGRAGTIDDAYSTISKGGTLEVVCAGDAVGSTIGLVTVIAVKK